MPEYTCRGLHKHSTLASRDDCACIRQWLNRNDLHWLACSLCWLGLHARGGVLGRVGLDRLLWGRCICGQSLYHLRCGRGQTDRGWCLCIAIAASLNGGYPGCPHSWLWSVCQGSGSQITGSQVTCQAVLQILRSRLAKYSQVIQGADGLGAMLVEPAQQQEFAPDRLPAEGVPESSRLC